MMMPEGKPVRLRVAELFAGVGGFRLGLEKAKCEVVWSNQWEPSTKTQHASDCYERRFTSGMHVCEDIKVVMDSLEEGTNAFKVPEVDLVVGGFPCQDYSVAKSASQAHGINGKKGVLWWEILRLLEHRRPSYLLLENVDRLLKSPSAQRGRDFAIILSSLAGLGYAVEWRVINAADYGFPQRRRRVFLLGVQESKLRKGEFEGGDWIDRDGVFAKAFPVYREGRILDASDFVLSPDLVAVTDTFGRSGSFETFGNSGTMRNYEVWTRKTEPKFRGAVATLGNVLQDEAEVPEEFFVEPGQLESWRYLKGAKREERTHKSGGKYFYTEGAIAFPDSLDSPSRTILTGEGGNTPSRFKHIIECPSGRYRRLTPIELERLNGFPDGWTEGMPDGRRAFMMGNALVVGVVERIGKVLTAFAVERR